MGLMDDMKNKTSGMTDQASDKLRQRYEMLKDKHARGELDNDADTMAEYRELDSRFGSQGGQ